MDVFNERNGVEIRFHFSDAADSPTIPATVHWRLDCETTGRVIQGDTEVTPVPVLDETGLIDCYVTVEVPGSLNAIQSNGNARELKTLLVIANKDQDGEYSQAYQYYIKNLRGRS